MTFDLTASALEIYEGDIVTFDIVNKQYRDPDTAQILKLEADLSPVKWDFGDDRVAPAEAYGLYNIRHWFEQDRETPYVVEATHQGRTKTVAIQVRNLWPEVTNVMVSQNPRAGKPVFFKAVARDPGRGDKLTYLWKFGDGTTAEGPNAKHTYDSEGTYQVWLEVADEEGRADRAAVQGGNFPLKIGQAFDQQAINTFSVSGDIAQHDMEIEGTIIVGSTHNPNNSAAGGACQIRLEMRSGFYDMGITLTARLDPGFAPGNYQIGRSTEWDGMHKNDQSSRGTFFAEFVPSKQQAARIIEGKRISGPFWSDGGRLTIVRFEDGVLELAFEAELTENVPASFWPRKVRVTGALSTTMPGSAQAEAGESFEGTSNFSLPEDPGGSMKPAFDLKAYYCDGEEPAEFEILNSDPGANDINANYEDSGVAVRFSQVVDPDSLVDPDTLTERLLLVHRGAGDEYYKAKGGWVVSPKNPKVVLFIPQARLLPGVIWCVMVEGGENGIRSFGGNLLTGSELEAPSAEMAAACPSGGTDQFGSAFSTQVEVESTWVDVYQDSLKGEHAPLLKSRHAYARVYTYWQDVSDAIHPSALVREFPAKVFGMLQGSPMSWLRDQTDWEGPVPVKLKRHDLYTSEEKRHGQNTVIFYSPGKPKTNDSPSASEPNNYFAVIQPLSRDERPLDQVFAGTTVQVNKVQDQLELSVRYIYVESSCPPGGGQEQCGSNGPWTAELEAHVRNALEKRTYHFAKNQVPAEKITILGVGTQRFSTTPDCLSGSQQGGCPDGPEAIGEADGPVQISPVDLAAQVTNRYLEGPDYEKRVAFLVAVVPPGFLPDQWDPDDGPIYMIPNTFPTPHVIILPADRINEVALTRALVWLLLGNEACFFVSDQACRNTYVQGFIGTGNVHFGNKHHVEGNAQGDQLFPLVKWVPYDQYNPADFHISAYNYAKLYEALQRRFDFANGNPPDS